MREFLNRVTQVNTKERWLNDHHRAVVSGKDFDPITIHQSNKEPTIKITEKHLDQSLMRAAGVFSLPDYTYSPQENKLGAYPGYEPKYSPQKPYDYMNEYKAPEYTPNYEPPQFDSSKKDYYGLEAKSKTFDTPAKAIPSPYPVYSMKEEEVSHHSYRGSKQPSKQGSIHGSVHDSVHGSAHGSVHGSVRSSAHGSVRGAAHVTPRGSQQNSAYPEQKAAEKPYSRQAHLSMQSSDHSRYY